MSKRDIKLYLRDILDAINAIEKFVEGMDFEGLRRMIKPQALLSESLR